MFPNFSIWHFVLPSHRIHLPKAPHAIVHAPVCKGFIISTKWSANFLVALFTLYDQFLMGLSNYRLCLRIAPSPHKPHTCTHAHTHTHSHPFTSFLWSPPQTEPKGLSRPTPGRQILPVLPAPSGGSSSLLWSIPSIPSLVIRKWSSKEGIFYFLFPLHGTCICIAHPPLQHKSFIVNHMVCAFFFPWDLGCPWNWKPDITGWEHEQVFHPN